MSGLLPTTTVPQVRTPDAKRSLPARALEALLTQRVVLLAVLIVVVLVIMTVLDAVGALSGSYNSDYLAASLINAVPLAMLGLAQLGVILSGRGGIDLSVGSMVSSRGVGASASGAGSGTSGAAGSTTGT